MFIDMFMYIELRPPPAAAGRRLRRYSRCAFCVESTLPQRIAQNCWFAK